jgi:two-component system, cell cycle response regulator DivK
MPRVLIVEDNPANLELVVEVLEPEGYELLTAETAEQGLRLAVLDPPALIVMDLHLPGMSGYEAIRALKADAATAAIPVIALTAQAMRTDEAQARAAGCDAYLTKPVNAQALRETLRRFLGGGPVE